jgi:hypothetical protein
MRIRLRDVAVVSGFAFAAAGWPACQPSGTSAHPTASAAAASCKLTVLYQDNDDGEIEPCG